MRKLKLFGLLFLLLGCTVTPTGTPVESPTAAPLSTATATALMTPADTPTSVVMTVAPAPSATPTITPEPLPTLTPWPTLPGITPGATELILPDDLPLCRRLPQPGLLLHDPVDVGGQAVSYRVVDGRSAEQCRLYLPGWPWGEEIQSAGGALFYPVVAESGDQIVIWRYRPDDEAGQIMTALSFTATPFEPMSNQFTFALSEDGRQIAWARFQPDTSGETAVLRNTLWAADLVDGQATELLAWETPIDADVPRYFWPLRFSADDQTLYLAWQPIGLGGAWSSFAGHYDTLYQLAVDGSQPEPKLIFDCEGESRLCLGDFSPEQGRLVYGSFTDNQIRIIDWTGELLYTSGIEDINYAGYPAFQLGGSQLAVVAGWVADPYSEPGSIMILAEPYREPIVTAAGFTTIWGWLAEDLLVLEAWLDGSGPAGTALVTLNDSSAEVVTFPYRFITAWR